MGIWFLCEETCKRCVRLGKNAKKVRESNYLSLYSFQNFIFCFFAVSIKSNCDFCSVFKIYRVKRGILGYNTVAFV